MLDSIKTFEKYDMHEMSFSIEHMPEQIHLAWKDTRDIKMKSMKSIQNIVLVGMGGSGIAAELVSMVAKEYAKIPVTVVHDYDLPSFVNSKTLVVLLSFSGDTEEVLHTAKLAKKRKAKLAAVTSGGKLARFAKKEKAALYKFHPGELADTPNQGISFMLMGTLGLLERAKLIKLSAVKVRRMLEAMGDVSDTCALNVDIQNNPAKTVAIEAKNKPVLFIGSEHLSAVVKTMAYQSNETAKQYARHMSLPELNHHFFEGLARPVGLFSKFTILMVRSDLYHKRNGIRYEMTADVFEDLGATVIDYEAHGGEVLEEVGELLQFGAFLTYYMGIQNKTDLTQIPYVELIKKKMSKEK